MMRVFAIGDVVGKTGVAFIRSVLPAFHRTEGIDFCVINGENAAQSNGLTPEVCEELFVSGADVITTGNHVFRRKELYDYLDDNGFVLRPANLPDSDPGKGYCIVDKGRVRVGVINLLGTTFMDPLESPFLVIDRLMEKLSDCRIILVDLHAEATSEKRAFGFYLDGRASAVFGTHTHVQTADEQVLPQGTGYITDLGMTGTEQSVLGVEPDIIIRKFRTRMPERFDFAEGEPMLCGCIFDIDEKTGRCLRTERICIR